MIALLRAARRASRTSNVGTWTACLTVSLTLFLSAATWALLGIPLLSAFLPRLVAEVSALLLVAVFHAVLHAGGWTGGGTSAGLRLAALALAPRALWEASLRWGGFDTTASAYDTVPALGVRMWLVRNVGDVAFAYGLALTVFAALADAARRRRHPAWVPSLED